VPFSVGDVDGTPVGAGAVSEVITGRGLSLTLLTVTAMAWMSVRVPSETWTVTS